MSLKTRFKTDAVAASGGVWVDYSAYPNKDGSIPGFLLARVSKQNKRYQAAIRELTRDAAIGANGLPDTSALDDSALVEIFVRTVLLDWRNFQPNDDGFPLPFTEENAKQILLDAGWTDLYDDLVEKAQSAGTFREKVTENEAKNS